MLLNDLYHVTDIFLRTLQHTILGTYDVTGIYPVDGCDEYYAVLYIEYFCDNMNDDFLPYYEGDLLCLKEALDASSLPIQYFYCTPYVTSGIKPHPSLFRNDHIRTTLD